MQYLTKMNTYTIRYAHVGPSQNGRKIVGRLSSFGSIGTSAAVLFGTLLCEASWVRVVVGLIKRSLACKLRSE